MKTERKPLWQADLSWRWTSCSELHPATFHWITAVWYQTINNGFGNISSFNCCCLFIIKIDWEESTCAVHVQRVCVNMCVCVLPVVRVPQQQSLAACTAVWRCVASVDRRRYRILLLTCSAHTRTRTHTHTHTHTDTIYNIYRLYIIILYIYTSVCTHNGWRLWLTQRCLNLQHISSPCKLCPLSPSPICLHFSAVSFTNKDPSLHVSLSELPQQCSEWLPRHFSAFQNPSQLRFRQLSLP